MVVLNKKRIVISCIALVVALILLFTLVIPMLADLFGVPVAEGGREIEIIIEENSSIFDIGNLLKEKGLIRSSFMFVLKAKLGGYRGTIASGKHTLYPSMTLGQICKTLIVEKPVRHIVTVTFPEGYSIEQMAMTLEENNLVSQEEFIEALYESYEYDFIDQIPDDRGNYYKLQGFLFPDTYDFYDDNTAHEIVDKMLSRFNEVYFSMAADSEGIYDIITKASMIEKEAKLESERPTIAGVIENRIIQGMPFQIDATVLYAATDGLYNEDDSTFIAENIRTMDSPYNTYLYTGLPAGPICNPGVTSISAALNPEVHPYLYYHTDSNKNDGSHIFTETYGEHLSTMN